MATRANCCTAATRSSSWPPTATHLETCYLLLNGELPNATQKTEFTDLVTNHTMVHEQMQFFLRGFRRDAHPMAVLTGLVGAPVGVLPRHAWTSTIRSTARSRPSA